MVFRNCDLCKKQISYDSLADMKRRSKTGMCRSCYLANMASGEKSSNWKGGVIIHGRGYRLIHMPEHPFSKGNGYIFEHRLVMEKHLGRYLKPDEIIHHLNSIKDDNRIENLVVTDNIRHIHEYDAHSNPKYLHCSICPEKYSSNGYCKKHYWTEYLKQYRKESGYYDRAKARKKARKS